MSNHKTDDLHPSITISVSDLADLIKKSRADSTPPPAPIFANPGGLGLAGFATTTFMLSVYNTNSLMSTASTSSVLPMALFYGGLVQLLVGLLEFRVNNIFGGQAFTSYGAFWMSYWYLSTYVVPTLAPNLRDDAVGLYLLVWTIFSFYMMIASFRISKALAILFLILEPTFIFLVAGHFARSTRITAIGGWLGICCALMAFYCSAATIINGVYKQEILPVGTGGFNWCTPVPPPTIDHHDDHHDDHHETHEQVHFAPVVNHQPVQLATLEHR